MRRRDFHRLALATVAGSIVPRAVFAAAAPRWSPTRPLRLVSGHAGGILGVFAQQLADKLAGTLGQPVIVDNKGGAGGILAMVATASSPPDGHTVGITTFVEMTVNPWLYDRLPYDPLKSFSPVSMLYSGQILLVAVPSFSGNSLSELIGLAKRQPKRYFYGTSGIARPPHIWVERFKRLAGVEILHVPYKGAGPLVTGLLSGDIPLAMEGVPPLLPHILSGRLKPLAVTGDRRLAALPDTPTFAEVGYPAMGRSWVGAVAPAATPAAAILRLNEAFVHAMNQPDIKAAQEQAGRIVVASSVADLENAIRRELPEWATVVREAHIKPE